MKIINFEEISNLNISPIMFYSWVEEMLAQKYTSILPPKISITQAENSFFNVMPCVLPCFDVMGVKMVTRYPIQTPSLSGQIMIHRQSTGNPLALMDGTYITALRTGAVASHSINTFAKNNFESIGILGCGVTARATLHIFSAMHENRKYNIRLLRYKDQAESFINRFKDHRNLSFSIHDNAEDVIKGSDVILSCVTYADSNFAKDFDYTLGCTVIPVHTRGFQNCDLFFDKVFADDHGHVKHFQHFDKFKSFAQTCDVLSGKATGRTTDDERILIYNIGIAIHDIFFAYKIFSMCEHLDCDVELSTTKLDKFWI